MALTPHAVLRTRLIDHLASVGGSQDRAEILEALASQYADLWTIEDQLPQNTRQFESKWRNRVSFERQRMVDEGLLEARSDGIWKLTAAGSVAVLTTKSARTLWLQDEVARREALWAQLLAVDGSATIAPNQVRQLGFHAGQRGVYVDVAATRSEWTPDGVALGLLHLGTQYSNDIASDGVIYQFPTTQSAGRDRTEIASIAMAQKLMLPVFVIERTQPSSPVRVVHRGLVEAVDLKSGVALITFYGADPVPTAEPDDDPFELTAPLAEWQTARRRPRPNQARFAFRVFARYGRQCAVCDLTHKSVLQAAHLRPKAGSGSDDPRNGLPLCANHHGLLDSHAWAIDPQTKDVLVDEHESFASLGITRTTTASLRAYPADEALEDLFSSWNRARKT